VLETAKIIFRTHAIQRMFQRGVDELAVRAILATGDTIEEYPDDIPYLRRLILGWIGKRPLHIVAADNVKEHEIIIVTVYEPDEEKWSTDFKRRIP
jgi:hypothetical protein